MKEYDDFSHDELERCKQVCDALLGALKTVEPILARMYGAQAASLPPMQTVRAAIAKAEGRGHESY